MHKIMSKAIIALTFCLASAACLGVEPGDGSRVQRVLEQLGVETAADELATAPIRGFKEIVRGMQVLYISDDGRLLINGDILSVAGESNLTERRRAQTRLELIAAIPLEDRLVVPARGERRGRMVVFVDTDCTYCRLFHERAPELASGGVEIHYLFYPRSGPAGKSFSQAVSVWCAEDRVAALGRVLSGSVLPAAGCNNPVLRHFELARGLELKGTPAIISGDGAIRYGLPERDTGQKAP